MKMMNINVYNNPIPYLLGCVPLELENNFDKVVNFLETVIEVTEYAVFKDYVEIFELDIKYHDLIERLYYRAIYVERVDLIVLFFSLITKKLPLERTSGRALEVAVENGLVKSLDLLIKIGYDSGWLFGYSEQRTLTALEFACKKNYIELVEYLLKMGVDPNIASCEDNGISPLQYAMNNNNYTMIKLLLDYDANPYYLDLTSTNIDLIMDDKTISISKKDMKNFEGLNDNLITEDRFIDIIRMLDNKKIANIKGSVFDIAIDNFGIKTAKKVLDCGCISNFGASYLISKLIVNYNHSVSRDKMDFDELYDIIITYLNRVSDRRINCGTSIMLEYSLIKENEDEEKYIELFHILKKEFALDYQRQMNEYALVRLAFRNKNIALMEYFVNTDKIPVEFDDSQNIFHDIAIFNCRVSECELDRICDIIYELKLKNIDPQKENDRFSSPMKRAMFIADENIRRRIIRAFEENVDF